MNNFNYLVALEGFLHYNSTKCSVAVLTAFAKNHGCKDNSSLKFEYMATRP